MSRADHSLPSPKSRNNLEFMFPNHSFFPSQVTRHKLIDVQFKPAEDSLSHSRKLFGHHLRERTLLCSSSKGSGQASLAPTTCRPAHTASEHVCMWGRVHPEAEALYLLTISHVLFRVSYFLFPILTFSHPSATSRRQSSLSKLQPQPQTIQSTNPIPSNNVPLSLSQMWCRHL
jgi:hypothetical protein